jgi:signal transduction histidine kinase
MDTQHSDKLPKGREQLSTEVASVISHQFKTPLAGIRSSLEVVIAGDLGPLTDEQHEYLSFAFENTGQLVLLVKDLLDVSRIDEGKFKVRKEPANLPSIIRSVVSDVSLFAKARNAHLTFNVVGEIPPTVLDAVKIREVVHNIVMNAIHYNIKKGDIVVTLERKGDTVLFTCADNGIGIPEKDRAKVFSRFHRGGQAIELSPDGSGLGLHIAKAIVEASGGKIWFDSEVDKGTTFYVSLPLQ